MLGFGRLGAGFGRMGASATGGGVAPPPSPTTAAQRLGAANILMPWRNILPVPDATIDAADRKILSNQYGAI